MNVMSRHKLFFLITLACGLALAVLGFALAAPIGSPDGPAISNPRMEFAPLVFVVGIALIFSSAVVYELVKD